VQRLNGLEASFLLRENATQNSNTGALIRLRPDDPDRPITLNALRAHVASRLDYLPNWRQRIQPVPFGLHHPVLIDDPDFDLDNHLSELTLPAPGDEATLNAAFAELTTHALDRRHPVWSLTLVSGIHDGSQALFYIMNHILMDGVGYISTLDGLCTDVPPSPPEPFVRPHQPEHPSAPRLIADAVKDQTKQLVRFPRLLKDTRTGRAAMAARIAQTGAELPPPPPIRQPLSPNYRPSIERRFATVDLPFDQVRAVRKASDVTINTVLLAVVAISLRRYLLRRDQLPDAPLVTGVMASTEPLPSPPRQGGNRFANFLVALATDTDDPWAEMLSISAATAEGKARLELLGIDMGNRWLEMIPPLVGVPLTKRQDKKRAAAPQLMRSTLIFSNVRGSDSYHFLGSSVTGLYTYGPIADAIGIFISSTNLGDTFHMVVITNPTALEDPDELAASFTDTLSELVALAQAHT
jgi:WS/DGAT/MGAT family acyltransferase